MGGKPMYQIVEELAEDNEYFAEVQALDCHHQNHRCFVPISKNLYFGVWCLFLLQIFLEAWQQFTSNGYTADDLVDGPDNGWLGYNSLAKQGISINNFEQFIERNKPVTFTDPKADPYICGHRGHSSNSCGIRFSTGAKTGLYGGPGDGPGLWFA